MAPTQLSVRAALPGPNMYSGIPSDAEERSSFILWLGFALLAVWLVVALPTAVGERTLYLRDVLGLHLPLKAFGAEQLQEGRIPVFNPSWAMGQPFRGNPNALPLYPGNVLYLLLPFWSAFNLHYMLHWLLAFFTMRGLARELGRSREACFVAGLTYAGSGWFLSTMTFYNLVVVAAWWPLAMIGALRGGRKGTALGGLACGLALLGGEPWTALLALAPMVWLAGRRHGVGKGLLTTGAIGLTGLILALPQVVATGQVLGFTVRGGPGLEIPRGAVYALHPTRLLELGIPLPFGWPGELGSLSMWLPESVPKEPFIYSLHFGLVGLWLAWKGRRGQPGLAALAAAGLVGAWLGGLVPALLGSVSGGTFRYPEKLLVWLALAAPLLVAAGFDRMQRDFEGTDRARARGLVIPAGVAAAAAVLVAVGGPVVRRGVRQSLESSDLEPEQVARSLDWLGAHGMIWLGALVVASTILALLALAIRRRNAKLVVILQMICLAQLFPLLRTAPVAPLAEPSPWLEHTGREATLVHGLGTEPPWVEAPLYEPTRENHYGLEEIRAHELDVSFGVGYGLEYPLARDFEGVYSPVHRTLTRALEREPWPGRMAWLRALGVDWVVAPADQAPPGLTPVETTDRFAARIGLYRVPGPRTAAWWPERLIVERRAGQMIEAVASGPEGAAFVPGEIEHFPGASVRLEEADPDRWVIRVSGEGGLLVLQRSFHPRLEARSEAGALATMPVDFALQGVQVPPGEHRIVVSTPNRLAWPAAVLSLAALVAVGVAGWRR